MFSGGGIDKQHRAVIGFLSDLNFKRNLVVLLTFGGKLVKLILIICWSLILMSLQMY